MARTNRKNIDWDAIPIVIEEDPEPNPRNPYSEASTDERERALSGVARSILLRRLKTIASN